MISKETIRVRLASALIGTALTLGTIAVSGVQGQTRSGPVQGADSIAAFWEKFKSAVIRSDKEKVAGLSRFPIARGYGMGSLKSKTQFMKRYREVFFAETDAAKCFPKAKPYIEKTRPKEFTISCPFARDGGNEEPFVYTFTRTRTGWKLTSFENINE